VIFKNHTQTHKEKRKMKSIPRGFFILTGLASFLVGGFVIVFCLYDGAGYSLPGIAIYLLGSILVLIKSKKG
jgi:hypothetical protein